MQERYVLSFYDLQICVVIFHLNASFFPCFSAVKHAETQSTNEVLAADIDKGKIFFKIFLCADQTIMNIMSYRHLIIFLPEFTFFFFFVRAFGELEMAHWQESNRIVLRADVVD